MARTKKEKLVVVEEVEDISSPTLDVDAIKAALTVDLLNQLSKDFDKKLNDIKQQLVPIAEQRREKIVLTGNNQYVIEADNDGLSFSKDNNFILVVGKNGQLSTGTRSARTVGKGSAHFKAGYSSEANMPTSGDGSTRGVIVEGDGDDNKTFIFRAVSRMNRQGTNIFSDGSVSINNFEKINDATFSVNHRFNDKKAVSFKVNSKAFEDNILDIDAAIPINKRWNAISVRAETYAKNYQTEIFNVRGNGNTYTHGAYHSNGRGYAEYFEWADGNNRNENRNGFTVTVDSSGKLKVADEGDTVIGVVVPNAAYIGNSAWNTWSNKFTKNPLMEPSTDDFQVTEWLEMESTLLQSYFKEEIPPHFAIPDTAEEIQTDSTGKNFSKPRISKQFNVDKEYTPRSERQGWALVCLLGVIPVYKGQTIQNSWIRLNNLNDELELWLIK